MNVVKETINKTDVAFVYYREKDLKDFKEKSGDLALSNEYQCHYDALMITYTYDDKSKVYHIFPLVYYNYPQKVSGASIDFDMKDVSKTAELLDKHTIEKYKELKAMLENRVSDIVEAKFSLTRFNNIHKHP